MLTKLINTYMQVKITFNHNKESKSLETDIFIMNFIWGESLTREVLLLAFLHFAFPPLESTRPQTGKLRLTEILFLWDSNRFLQSNSSQNSKLIMRHAVNPEPPLIQDRFVHIQVATLQQWPCSPSSLTASKLPLLPFRSHTHTHTHTHTYTFTQSGKKTKNKRSG